MLIKPISKMTWFVLILITGLMLQLAIFPMVTQADPNHTFYISPSGNDTNPGSLDQPFATIKRGTKSFQPGDTLVLREGTYSEQIDLYSMNGSPSAWYTQVWMLLRSSVSGAMIVTIHLLISRNNLRLRRIPLRSRQVPIFLMPLQVESWQQSLMLL